MAVTSDREAARRLAASLAPDLATALDGLLVVVAPAAVTAVLGHRAATGIVAIARRPTITPAALLATRTGRPVVLLDRPSFQGNVGAVVRVAAAADAAGVLVLGPVDPWNTAALRGSAGLHFALPVTRCDALPDGARPLIAVHPEAPTMMALGEVPPGAVLAFGAERDGLKAGLLARADARVAIPMRDGVSSLNLATAVAVALYGVGGP